VVLVKWSFRRRQGGDARHTSKGVYRRHKCGESSNMQISILLVAAVIIPCSILFGAVLGMFAMLVIRVEASEQRAELARSYRWPSGEDEMKKTAIALAYRPGRRL
jgi:hypothetical protein